MSASNKTTQRKCLEAYTRDVGRGVARIDYKTMDEIGCSTGDIISLTSEKQQTVAKCLPLYPSDEGKGIVRIDGLSRANCKTSIGLRLMIEKIKAESADKMEIRPIEEVPPIDERYVSDALEAVPVIENDTIMIPYFGGRLTFIVEKLEPDCPCIITQKTITTILPLNSPKENNRKIDKIAELIEDEKDRRLQQLKVIVSDADDLKNVTGEIEEITQKVKKLEELKKLFVECFQE